MPTEEQQKRADANQNISLDPLIEMLKDKGFEIEQNKDSGAGPIDLVCKISVHPSLPAINCGFIVLKSEEGGSKDYEDNQFSLRKIQDAWTEKWLR